MVKFLFATLGKQNVARWKFSHSIHFALFYPTNIQGVRLRAQLGFLSQVWKGYAIVCLKPPRFLSAYWTPPTPPLQPPAQQTHEEIAEEACQRPVSLHFILAHMSNTIPLACAVSQHCENTQLRLQRTAISISTPSRLQTVMRHALLPVLPTNDADCHMRRATTSEWKKKKNLINEALKFQGVLFGIPSDLHC